MLGGKICLLDLSPARHGRLWWRLRWHRRYYECGQETDESEILANTAVRDFARYNLLLPNSS